MSDLYFYSLSSENYILYKNLLKMKWNISLNS